MREMLELIKEKIRKDHSGDKNQLDVIFSDDKRIILEAPAGCGKTKTMISKIAYLIASGNLPNPKKVLALTFSVNAAYKIKKDIANNLPQIFQSQNIAPHELNKKVQATNYHGFSRQLLKQYGYLLEPKLKEIDILQGVGDSKFDVKKTNLAIPDHELSWIESFSIEITNNNIHKVNTDRDKYLDKIMSMFLSQNYITFNAIILYVLKLFEEYPEIKKLCHKCFPLIIVDEFQDTNMLGWSLLQTLISNDTNLFILGDPLQRIYGFIGAIDKLMEKCKIRFNMTKKELTTNYRFQNNQNLQSLDKNIREIAKYPDNPEIKNTAKILLYQKDNQDEEAKFICKTLKNAFQKHRVSNFAILVKQRGKNVDKIIDVLERENINYFYALFSEEQEEYRYFHLKSANIFKELIKKNNTIFNNTISNRFLKDIETEFSGQPDKMIASLISLLKTFLQVLSSEYSFLDIEERINFTKDTLEGMSLKQYLGYVNSKVIITTIHGAKGLEWDYVLLPDMEKWGFPSYNGLCRYCIDFDNSSNNLCNHLCDIDWNKAKLNDKFMKKYFEELSVFYVAVTRAKKNVCFTHSNKRINNKGLSSSTNLSCFLKFPGIEKKCK
jgi:DNA helicase II / ATP-dependent DNA helicase PcrA